MLGRELVRERSRKCSWSKGSDAITAGTATDGEDPSSGSLGAAPKQNNYPRPLVCKVGAAKQFKWAEARHSAGCTRPAPLHAARLHTASTRRGNFSRINSACFSLLRVREEVVFFSATCFDEKFWRVRPLENILLFMRSLVRTYIHLFIVFFSHWNNCSRLG